MRTVERELRKQLRRDEGERRSPYYCTSGKITIGIGRNLSDKGLSHDEVEQLFNNDLNEVFYKVEQALPWASELDDARFGVLLNMAFQMGLGGLLTFRKTLSHIRDQNYIAAAKEMLDSNWAKQTSSRAYRLSQQMETGEWQ